MAVLIPGILLGIIGGYIAAIGHVGIGLILGTTGIIVMLISFRIPFRRQDANTPVRTYNDRENLSAWEKNYLNTQKTCPDCATGELMEGPHGGIAINFKCEKCGSAFNLVPLNGSIIFAARISDSSLKQKEPLVAIG